MARRMANKAAVESIRKRLGMDLAPFSVAIGYGESAYGDMLRSDKITETAALAAEALMRRQAPGATDELMYLTRIVRGVPVITMLDDTLREMTLDGECFLLIPKEQQRAKAAPVAHAGNGMSPDPAHRPMEHAPDGFGNG